MRYWSCSEHFMKITLPLHILAIFGIATFDEKLMVKHIISFAIGWILISGCGIAVGYHRYFSHQSFKTYKLCEPLLAFLGCLGAQGSPVFWVGLHMGLHHPYSDKEQDLHSPQNGFLNSYFGWQVKLGPHSAPLKPASRFFSVKYMRILHKHYYKVFWLTTVVIYLILPSYWLFGLLLPMLASVHQENIINSTCHIRSLGYRNFATNDESVNNPLWGVLFFGQGWHNNHHAYPRKAYYGHKWFEIDPSWIIIKLIERREKKRKLA